eukprot:15200349-Alexandrium_andersonii.AAC.1
MRGHPLGQGRYHSKGIALFNGVKLLKAALSGLKRLQAASSSILSGGSTAPLDSPPPSKKERPRCMRRRHLLGWLSGRG